MNDLLNYFDRELPVINRFIDDETEKLSPAVRPLVKHVFTGGGKRLRPLLTILTARCLAGTDRLPQDIYPLACSLEFLHSATLLHDDILDGAQLRRGQPAAHVVFGQTETILAGDLLLALANWLVANYNLPALSKVLSEAIMSTVLGEIDEIAKARNPSLDRAQYLDIITGKTAYLIQAACRCGAIAVLAGIEMEECAAEFGLNLGIAFQLVDDALDYVSPSDVSGKPSGSDLREGKFTLPLILYLESLPEAERSILVSGLETNTLGEEDIRRAVAAVEAGGFAARTRDIAGEYLAKAEQALSAFPDNHERQVLAQALQFVLIREK
jgi:octaprenyl-diphosphate synthase